MSFFQLTMVVLVSAAALSAIMAFAWVVQQRIGSSRWVDGTWTFGVGAVGLIAALWPLAPAWPGWRQGAVAVLSAAWCLRLGLHMADRARTTADDPRYHAMAKAWGADAPRQMFRFLQSQAAVALLLVLAIALAAHNRNPALRLADLLAAVILIVAISGEMLADRQLQAFRRHPANQDGICDAGLWAWSRHPNYFFEWLAWVAYPVMAIDFAGHNPYGWFALAAPAAMYYILNYVSGIPPLEQHMLRTRGNAFRAYQARTPAFFPMPFRS